MGNNALAVSQCLECEMFETYCSLFDKNAVLPLSTVGPRGCVRSLSFTALLHLSGTQND